MIRRVRFAIECWGLTAAMPPTTLRKRIAYCWHWAANMIYLDKKLKP